MAERLFRPPSAYQCRCASGAPDSTLVRAETDECCKRLLIASGLSEFKDAVSLKKDGRRVSLEGVLTGAALAIVLLYLVEDAAAAGAGPPIGGPLQDPGEVDPGSLSATAGRIQIRPLDDLGLGFDDVRPQGFASGSAAGLAAIGAGAAGGRWPRASRQSRSRQSSP